MGCCKCFCDVLNRSILLAFNLVDLLIGLALIVYGFYIREQLDEEREEEIVKFIMYVPLGIGLLLLFTSLLSFLGMIWKGCRCSLLLSAWLALPIGLLEAYLGILSLWKSDKVTNFLETHKDDLHVNDEWISRFSDWYQFFCYIMFGLFALELMRFIVSRSIKTDVDNELDQYRSLLMDEDEYNASERERTQFRGTNGKFDALRKKYSNNNNAEKMSV